MSSSQRGKEYLSKLKNLLPSVFDEFKHDELERYFDISYNAMKNSYYYDSLLIHYFSTFLVFHFFRVAEVLGKKRSAVSVEIEDTFSKQEEIEE